MLVKKLLLAFSLIFVICVLSSCAALKAISGALGSTSNSNSGTSVSGNSLHAGKKEINTTGTDYSEVGEIHHNYMKQTGDYVLRIVGLLGILGLLGFIAFRFFKFLKKVVSYSHRARFE